MGEILRKTSIDDKIAVALVCLMGVGLALATGFLLMNKITGDNWTTLCLALFGACQVGNSVKALGQARS